MGAIEAITAMTAASLVKARPTWLRANRMTQALEAMKIPPTATQSQADKRAVWGWPEPRRLPTLGRGQTNICRLYATRYIQL